MYRSAFRFGIVALALASFIRTTEMVDGADLRSTRGERMVVRQVSAAAESPNATSDADVFAEPAIEPYSLNESLFTPEPYVFEPDGVEAYAPYDPRWHDGLWVDVEFLLWWRKGQRIPPLVTTDDPGLLPTATVLFGGGEFVEQPTPGGRLDFGLWLDDYQNFGLGADFTALNEAQVQFTASDNVYSFVARPYFDANPAVNAQAALPFVNLNPPPGFDPITGQLDVRVGSQILASDVYYRLRLLADAWKRMDLVFGYQTSRVDEDLVIAGARFQGTEGDIRNPISGTRLAVSDIFSTKNEFHGGHFGLRQECRFGRWGLGVLTKFGFGTMRQTVFIQGSQTVDVFDSGAIVSTVDRPSGLLAQNGFNAGEHKQDVFSFTEDIRVKLAYYPTERLRLSVGYSLLFWSSLAHPGDHIDLNVDDRLLDGDPANDAGATRPRFSFNPTRFFIHGLTLGADYRF